LSRHVNLRWGAQPGQPCPATSGYLTSHNYDNRTGPVAQPTIGG
jgi:hypothetical protein